ncbi:MAG: hypothetical protein Q8Q09_00105 [Deltaproteobacteria bacterium]|nr:hypothetical protein [Deltaproteobacteria bacterium]
MNLSKNSLCCAALFALSACGQPAELDPDSASPRDASVTDATLRDATTSPLDAPPEQLSDATLRGPDGTLESPDSATDGATALDTLSSGSDASQDAPDARNTPDGTRPPLVCASGTANCNMSEHDGCEVILGTTGNCGGCGDACIAGPHASPRCASGTCQITCDMGFGDCDGDPRNGCEIDLNRAPEHCGRCANRCGGGANANPVCAGGLCGLSCNAGFADCDISLANGCEADLNNNASHCRTCGNVCAAPANATGTCGAGACDFRCNVGLNRCGAQCVRPDDPAFGCGTCTACPMAANATSMACGATGCIPSSCAVGYKLCGTQCVAISNPAYGCTGSSCSTCILPVGASAMMCQGGGCAIASCAAGFKLCGGNCVSVSLPQYGCSASTSCTSCAVQNAAAVCNAAGGCDYAMCNNGWRDLDGNRANGCETAAPSTIAGLRVWLSTREPGSLVTNNCTAFATEQCVSRWNNLADPANPATVSGNQPIAWFPNGDGTAREVLINGQLFHDSGMIYFAFAPTQNRQFSLGLSAVTNSHYTAYIVDMPMRADSTHALACTPDSVFDTNGAFHLGWASPTQMRLGHYNNDLNLTTTETLFRPRLLIASQSPTGRTLSRTNASGTLSASDSNTGLVTHSNNCTIGRGLDNTNKYMGAMYEILLFNRALTATEQNTVRTYISRRYGI